MIAHDARTTWLPAHPVEGSISMNRYWESLWHSAQSADWPIDCPLGNPGPVVTGGSRLKRIWHRYVAYSARLRFYRCSPLVHVLDHSSAFLLNQLPRGVRTVVTVHDLIPLRDRQGLSDRQYRRFVRCIQPIRTADVVIAVSEHTRRDLQHWLDIPAERIVVIPHGVDKRFFAPTTRQVPVQLEQLGGRKIVLSVGNLQPRKNLDLLPPALALLRARVPDICLVRVGSQMPRGLRNSCAQAVGGDQLVIELGMLDDALLPAVYARAAALFFPSRLEGFGLPLLEAMAAGCPVVCSNATSLPEVGGDVAQYFNPNSPQEAAAALARVLDDESARRELVQRGRRRAAQFTWDRHFAEVREVYRRLWMTSRSASDQAQLARLYDGTSGHCPENELSDSGKTGQADLSN